MICIEFLAVVCYRNAKLCVFICTCHFTTSFQDDDDEHPSRTADYDSQQPRAPVRHNTTLIHAPIRVDIVIRKRVTLPIDLFLVNESAEPIDRSSRLVIPVRVDSRLQIPSIDHQCPAIESSAQTRHDGAVNCIVRASDCKGSTVAAKDVCGGGFGIGAVVACAGQDIIGDSAGDSAGLGLGVDRKSVGRVMVPDGVDMLGEVGLESGGVQGDIVDGGDDAEGFTRAGGLAEVAPGHSVASCLSDEGGADCRDGVGVQAFGGLGAAVAGLH